MNLISLGIDVQSFDESKKRVLNEYVSLFNTLEKWDGHVFNPILGGGLAEFNTSVSNSTKLLAELNDKISVVSNNLISNSRTNSGAAKTQDELSLAVKAYTKTGDDAAKISAKLAALTSDQAKETMALKLQLSEVSKSMLDTVKNTQSLIQQQIAYSTGIQSETKHQAENNAMKMQAVNSLRELAVQQEKSEKEYNKVWAAAEQERKALASLNAEQARIIQSSIDKKLREEDAAVKALTRDYDLLRKALIEQQNAYSLAYRTKGVSSPEAVKALNDYKTTAAIVGDIDKNLGKATGSGKLFGGALSSAFSQLRMIAYILPGIGIAGIFTLAFEAIGKAVQAAGFFENKLEKQLALEKELNDNLNDQIGLRQKIYETASKLYGETAGSSAVSFKRAADEFKARGYSTDQTDPVDIEAARRELKEAQSKLIPGDEKRVGKLINDQVFLLRNITKLQDAMSDPNYEKEKIQKGLEEVKKSFLLVNPSSLSFQIIRSFGKSYTDLTKEQVERLKSQLNLAVSDSNDKLNHLQDINIKQDNLSKLENSRLKKDEDERRKLTVENSKEELSLSSAAAEKLLNQEITSEQRRIYAMRKVASDRKASNLADLNNVTGNKSSTGSDIQIAQSKYTIENAKIDLKLEEDIQKLRETYRQRFLKATESIKKDELEKNAIANEKIYKNEENSLEQRIKAYDIYLSKKQAQQDLEYTLAREALSLKANDPTAKKEIAALEANRRLMKSNIQSDAEAQTFNIVNTALKKQLKDVIDENNAELEINKKAYAEELNNYNDLYHKKQITLKDYIAQVKVINSKYNVSGLDEDIADDKRDIGRLNTYLSKNRKLRDNAKDRVDITENEAKQDPTSLNKKRDYDEAVGEYKARNEDIKNAEKDLQIELRKLDDDELKRAKAKTDELIALDEKRLKHRNRVLDVISNLEGQLYNSVVSISAKNEKIEEEANANRQKVVDDGYENEIAAIEKASLSSKDKSALDIQLNQQKLESDKRSEHERAKMRHDQAVFEKDLSISQIIIATSLAIMKAAPDVLLQFEAAATGAVALGTAVATKIPPIPSYELGTRGKPHPGGLARTGEKGKPEVVFEPYKSPYLVLSENVSYLPAGTEVIPIKDSPDFSSPTRDDSWEQTRWLAKQISKNNKPSIFSPVNNITIDIGTETWKRKIIGN